MELQVRYDLIQALVKMNDLSLLQKLETVINSHVELDSDWWNHISKEERSEIQEGIRQLDRGELLSHDQVRSRINAKLGK